MKLIVEARKCEPQGILRVNQRDIKCALGPAGLVADKMEGDGGTPLAAMRCLKVLYRADRLPAPATGLPLQVIEASDGWCDDPLQEQYNQQVRLPFAGSHELLWREDQVYDICCVLDWNLSPAQPGKGSAIFFHLARDGYPPTEGCVAVSLEDMKAILDKAGSDLTLETRLAD